MNSKQKKILLRIFISLLLFVAGLIAPLEGYRQLWLFIPAYLLIGFDVLATAIRNIIRGHVFDENFLMSLATVGAFAVGEYPEAVAVMLFYQVGELFQSYAVGKSRASIAALMDIRPDIANVERAGELLALDPYEVAVGEVIVVKAGERIPLDGVVLTGQSAVDTSALTGEAMPRLVEQGSDALSGCINLSGLLRIQVSKPFAESTVAKILDLVENASSKKAPAENFITKFARYYTPLVVVAALMLAVLPPLLLPEAVFSDWLHRALIFLVVSCPCALVISVPLSFFGGIGGASKCGILVKGSNYLEALAAAEIIVFDKTGTLTQGAFTVTEIQAVDNNPTKLLELAALAELHSNHPIALSIQNAYAQTPDITRVTKIEEIAGHGVQAVIDGAPVLVGSQRLLEQQGIPVPTADGYGTVLYIARSGSYLGQIVIADDLKPTAQAAIRSLKQNGVTKTVMLTGDRRQTAEIVAQELGIDEVYSELLPADKVTQVERLLTTTTGKGRLAFVGDGMNDAPVLSRADIGIAMGGLGSDAAIEAADIVIMDDNPAKVAVAMTIARRTLRIVKQNIIFALGIKAIVLIMGAFGYATMWEAVFADVGVSVIAIINATRALKVADLQK